MPDTDPETRFCEYDCAWDPSAVSVSGSIHSFFLQWRSIEVRGYCGQNLAAICAGHGDCHGQGAANGGQGACQLFVGGGVDATGTCFANSPDEWIEATIDLQNKLASGTVCTSDGWCSPADVQCMTDGTDVACGINRTQAQLSENLMGEIHYPLF